MNQQTRQQDNVSQSSWENWLATGQGAFYLATGIWPLVDMQSFMRVTGPKTDHWLVKTAGVLITAIGGAVALAGTRRQVSPEIRWLAIASAAGLTAIDVVYVAQRRIAPIYLLDAATEVALIGSWLVAGAGSRRVL